MRDSSARRVSLRRLDSIFAPVGLRSHPRETAHSYIFFIYIFLPEFGAFHDAGSAAGHGELDLGTILQASGRARVCEST